MIVTVHKCRCCFLPGSSGAHSHSWWTHGLVVPTQGQSASSEGTWTLQVETEKDQWGHVEGRQPPEHSPPLTSLLPGALNPLKWRKKVVRSFHEESATHTLPRAWLEAERDGQAPRSDPTSGSHHWLPPEIPRLCGSKWPVLTHTAPLQSCQLPSTPCHLRQNQHQISRGWDAASTEPGAAGPPWEMPALTASPVHMGPQQADSPNNNKVIPPPFPRFWTQ